MGRFSVTYILLVDAAPVSLHNRHTITFRQVSDHKYCGQKNDGQTAWTRLCFRKGRGGRGGQPRLLASVLAFRLIPRLLDLFVGFCLESTSNLSNGPQGLQNEMHGNGVVPLCNCLLCAVALSSFCLGPAAADAPSSAMLS